MFGKLWLDLPPARLIVCLYFPEIVKGTKYHIVLAELSCLKWHRKEKRCIRCTLSIWEKPCTERVLWPGCMFIPFYSICFLLYWTAVWNLYPSLSASSVCCIIHFMSFWQPGLVAQGRYEDMLYSCSWRHKIQLQCKYCLCICKYSTRNQWP